MTLPRLTLYGTSGCHLCDEAEALLRLAAPVYGVEWDYVDIALDAQLCERFGTRIPVLTDGRTLAGWPFSLVDIGRLAAGGR